MLAFIGRRLLALVPLVLIVSFLAFGLVALLPGDAALAAAGFEATPENVRIIRHRFGLDHPFLTRYWEWLTGALHGDLGTSWQFAERGVWNEIVARFPATFSIALGAIVLAALIGVTAGIIAGLRPGRLVDRAISVFTSVAIAVPSFLVAILLVIVFSKQLGLLPSLGYVPFTENPAEWAQHLVMPWIALALPASASIARQVRGAMVDAMEEDYVRTARSKGLTSAAVVGKHALKNAAMPALTVLGIQFAYLLGGTVIIESIFSIPGIGLMVVNAISSRDVPVIQGVALTMAIVFLLVNLAVDIGYALVNPKVRLA